MTGTERLGSGSLTAEQVADLLGLEPLPREGGFFRQTWKDDHSTAIYYLTTPSSPSAFHRLAHTEVTHHLGGAPSRLHLLGADGKVEAVTLGPDLVAGQIPQIVKPAGCWQARETLGAWSLVGTTMAPGFSWDVYEDPDVEALCEQWPAAADTIRRLAPAVDEPGEPRT